MSYQHDPVHRTVHWLRTVPAGPRSFAAAWAHRSGILDGRVRVRIGLTNYKPFERARVMADVMAGADQRRGAGPLLNRLSLHVAATPADARREMEQAAGERCANARSPILLQDRGIVAWTLPHAPALGALADLTDPARFQEWAAARPALAGVTLPDLVRYVPLRRALLVGADLRRARRLWWKLFSGAEAADVAVSLREVEAWRDAGFVTFAVPRLVHHDPDRHVVVMSEVPGRPFTQLLTASRKEPFAEVGRALAELHAVKAVPGRSWSFAEEHAGLRRHMDGAKRALPALAGRIDALLDCLERGSPAGHEGFAPIHGNLFGDQILYDEHAPSGRRVGLVDWDACCHGDPHFDLGRLIAHLVYAIRLDGMPAEQAAAPTMAILDGYRDVAGHAAVDRARLSWQLATALLLRAKISSLRKLAPGWPRHLEMMIGEAENALDQPHGVLSAASRAARSGRPTHPEPAAS